MGRAEAVRRFFSSHHVSKTAAMRQISARPPHICRYPHGFRDAPAPGIRTLTKLAVRPAQQRRRMPLTAPAAACDRRRRADFDAATTSKVSLAFNSPTQRGSSRPSRTREHKFAAATSALDRDRGSTHPACRASEPGCWTPADIHLVEKIPCARNVEARFGTPR